MKRWEKKSATESSTSPGRNRAVGPSAATIEEDEAALFRNAVRDVAPLPASDKISYPSARQPQPVPRKIPQAEPSPPDVSSSAPFSLEVEPGDEWSFLRPGLSHPTLRRLRRGHWGIQAQLDLHGFNRDQARLELIAFLDDSHRRGFRCVRVIHGKGLSSRNHEPVLKARIGSWLAERNDVLAFCQARPEDGGSGAVLVLLRSPARGHGMPSG
ncbi:Smr/MutS family protein [Nitrosovibrio tenuis]|uniref:DNA-nicking endonuclease, Smr domain n=1 Tax=Nitrosovibrio tenuis TaxID=1233 RepID=A0A1H7RAU6_9PROT|nr:Smr/MutS family protein [Nitrosovibrio tenuis]SEL57259.1 DNA-nicking endonuclease, Smr domain [Nitrosovibrio tenuis]